MKAKLTRRNLLERWAFGSFWTAIGGALLGMAKLLKPAVRPDAAVRVKLGRPDELPAGSVKAIVEHNLYAIGTADGVYAISTICTHLGCIVRRLPNGRFDCPCHGSKFNARGEVSDGPAPSGLDWIEVRLAPNGVLYAETGVTVRRGTMWRRL